LDFSRKILKYMNEEPIKIDNNCLSEIKMLQEKFQQKTFEMGILYLEKMQIDELIKNTTSKEQKLQDEWNSLKNMENQLIDNLIKKYGEGSLDLSKGVFVSDKK